MTLSFLNAQQTSVISWSTTKFTYKKSLEANFLQLFLKNERMAAQDGIRTSLRAGKTTCLRLFCYKNGVETICF